MAHRSDSFVDWLGNAVARYSLLVYAAGLLIILLPTIMRYIGDTSLSLQVRRILVGAAIGAMILAYLAERRYRVTENENSEAQQTAPDRPEYSLYARLSLAGAAIGVAVGIYVGFARDEFLIGAMFIFGAYLFVRMGFRHEEQRRGR